MLIKLFSSSFSESSENLCQKYTEFLTRMISPISKTVTPIFALFNKMEFSNSFSTFTCPLDESSLHDFHFIKDASKRALCKKVLEIVSGQSFFDQVTSENVNPNTPPEFFLFITSFNTSKIQELIKKLNIEDKGEDDNYTLHNNVIFAIHQAYCISKLGWEQYMTYIVL